MQKRVNRKCKLKLFKDVKQHKGIKIQKLRGIDVPTQPSKLINCSWVYLYLNNAVFECRHLLQRSLQYFLDDFYL